jgi:8-oxo-dGTP diphosphatase
VNRFNLRVYGILINPNNEVLVSKELRFGKKMTKFPGGGLEFDEGLKDGLIREFKEELQQEVVVGELFYVNDFLQVSAFNPNDQLISFYYRVECPNWKQITTVDLDFVLTQEGEKQTWVKLETLKSEIMTFPIDKVVAERLSFDDIS